MKIQNRPMVGYSTHILALGLAGSLVIVGCGDENPGGTDSETDSDTGTNTDSDTGSDTGEDETPPNLPKNCAATLVQQTASEQSDYIYGIEGNGRFPDIAHNGSTLMGWSYFADGKDTSWRTQVVIYDAEKGGSPGPDGGQPEPTTYPADPGEVARKPSIAAKGDEFGLVWLDGRWDSSKSCVEDFNDCRTEVAFMRLDSLGQPIGSSSPVPLTKGAVVSARPRIAATETGYLVLWISQETVDEVVIAVPVDESGIPGTGVQISTKQDGLIDSSGSPVASLGDTAVGVWVSANQKKLMMRLLNLDGSPTESPFVLDEATQVYNPDIVAGDDGFLVSWSRKDDYDFEVFSHKLDGKGVPLGKKNRVTWTVGNIMDSAVAAHGKGFAVAWTSSFPNGSEECAETNCNPQVFASLLDNDGIIESVPVQLSMEPNTCHFPAISWDGNGFTAVYEVPRGSRHQIYYGRMNCK